MPKKTIALIRVSTATQAEDDRGGIPAQRAAIQRIAQQHQLEIVRLFEIEDVSGARVLASPEMQELLQLIESPEIIGVVCKEFSRLMRPENLSDYIILQRFIETRTMLFLPDGVVDLSNKSGRLFGVLRAAMAGFERQEIAERMRDGKEAIRRAGRHAGGYNSLPYGVSWSKAEGWRYTPESERVKEAFRQVLSTTRPYARIATELGIRRTSLRVILSNPIYTGWRVYDERRDPTAAGYVAGENGRQGWRRKLKRDQTEIIRVKVLPGIISEPEFQRVQEILADRAARERIIRSQNEPLYTFNGFLVCALCGNPLYSHRNQKAGYYYCKLNNTRARKKGQGCRNPYILSEKTESKIQELLSDRLQRKSILQQIAGKYLSGKREPAGVARLDLEASKQLIAVLQAKRERVLESFFEGVISRVERDKRLTAIDAELASCHDMVAQAIQPPQPRVTAAQLAEVLGVFAEFPFLNRDQKRKIMASTRARVFMDGYTIDRFEIRPLFAVEHSAEVKENAYIDDHSRTAMCVSRARRCR